MRAAVLHEYGVPSEGEFQEPVAGPGQAVVEVLAAGLNPVDVSICAGRFYAGKPPLPSVAGREGVGMLGGERVYFDAPILPFGSMAERALIDSDAGELTVAVDPMALHQVREAWRRLAAGSHHKIVLVP
jgi:NADPH:quinone reductase-like Zn-dependent oxidoreductase